MLSKGISFHFIQRFPCFWHSTPASSCSTQGDKGPDRGRNKLKGTTGGTLRTGSTIQCYQSWLLYFSDRLGQNKQGVGVGQQIQEQPVQCILGGLTPALFLSPSPGSADGLSFSLGPSLALGLVPSSHSSATDGYTLRLAD